MALRGAESATVAVRGDGLLAATLEVSSDGTTWQTAAKDVSGSQVVRVGGPGRPPVRALKVSPREGARHPGRIFEVLVW